LFALSTQIFSRQSPVAFKIFHPEFPAFNSEFEISLLASDKLFQYDFMSLLIYSEDNLRLVKCEIKNIDYAKNVEFRTNENKPGTCSYRIDIPGKFVEYKEKRFQINLTFKPEETYSAKISFLLETKDDASELENNANTSEEVWEYELPAVSLDFYDTKYSTGKAALIDSGSKIELQFLQENDPNNFLISFWAKTNEMNFPFFNIINRSAQDTILSISKTRFGIIKVPENLSEFDFNEYFIGNNSFNHYSVLLSPGEYEARLYLNKKLIYSAPYFMNYGLNQLSVEFSSDSSSFVTLDELKIIELGDDIQQVFNNIHYKAYMLDSSNVVYSQNFDSEDFDQMASRTGSVHMIFNNFKLIDSEAPIYSRTPHLRISTFESIYELSWTNLDDANVSQYEIEKSVDGRTYESLSEVQSLNDPSHNYYYVDNRNEQDEVVYYRIRQLNKDGSTNYSSGIKLGSAQIDYFNIEQNYPNPFNPSTSVTVEVFFEAEYEITVYDLVGTKIEIIYKGPLARGIHVFDFDGSNLTSGVYIFEVSSQYTNRAIKMLLAK
jgi:hypothetical protein